MICIGRLIDELKARRRVLGLSAKEAAARSDIDEKIFSDWEHGVGAPQLDAINRWATALGAVLAIVPVDFEAEQGLKIDWDGRRVAVDGKQVRLTPMEWRALERLARVPGELVTHQELFQHLYGEERHYRAESTAVRVLITKLRRLLPPLRIDAQWGQGYVVRGLKAGNDEPVTPRPKAGERRMAMPSEPAKCSRVETQAAPPVSMPEKRSAPPAFAERAPAGARASIDSPSPPRSCRAEELGVIERFLAERGATRCPDVATISQSPLPTLVWDKVKRKWIRPSLPPAAAAEVLARGNSQPMAESL
ncbi:MAG TPA: winged helix-turn-helix domain-containing protein [Stellaceae bacterium]|nr:winged helix-turn-helix domain-containing protein [Stellaceae bacterium]